MSFISQYHTGPVTALSCLADHLLTGIGSNVWVYNISDGKVLQTLSVLPAGVVHGFRPARCESRVCVYGQKTLRLLNVLPSSGHLQCAGPKLELPDWIWDAAWIQGANQMCLALGHNVVVTVDIQTLQVISSVHCTEKCILYCGRFLSTYQDCVVLAAGTVFNQVVLWSPQVAMVAGDNRAEPFHRLTGHQGVIFNVCYRGDLGFICSVSDDRSVRLYRVQFSSPLCDRCGGGASPCVHDWVSMETQLQHALYGHSARVWDARLLSSCLVTIGEDSTCCIWSYEGRMIHKFKGHKGKSIWSVCIDKGEKLVFTSGGDHSVRAWSLQAAQAAVKQTETSTLDLQLDADESPRDTKLLSVHRILVITNKGRLVLYDKSRHSRQVVMWDQAFSSYAEMSLSHSRHLVAIGNLQGTLRIFGNFDGDPEVLVEAEICAGKVFSIHWLDNSTILTSGPAGAVTVWSILDGTLEKIATAELPSSKQRFVSAAALLFHGNQNSNQYLLCGDKIGTLYLYRLHDQEGVLVQTFPKCHGKVGVTHVSCHGDRVYSAGRDGTYRLYEWSDSGQLNILHSHRVCKGLEWIERLVVPEEGPDNIQVQGFYSNLFVVWSVLQNQKLLEVPCGGGHRAWDYCCHGDTATFVHVKAREVKVTSIATRPSQVLIKEALHGRELHDARFVSSMYDSKGKLHGRELHDARFVSSMYDSKGKLHGRVVHDARFVSSMYDSKGRPVHAVATCSEDTDVCLALLYCILAPRCLSGTLVLYPCPQMSVWHSCIVSLPPDVCLALLYYEDCVTQLKVCHKLTSHISSVQCLAVCDSGKVTGRAPADMKLIFSGGGRAQLKVCRVQLGGNKHNPSSVCRNQTDPQLLDIGTDVHSIVECKKASEELRSAAVGEVQGGPACDQKGDCDTWRLAVDAGKSQQCPVTYESLCGLHLNNLTRRAKKPWRYPVENSDPETRLMDLCVVTLQGSRALFIVCAACSDGIVRLILFDEDEKEMSVIATSMCTEHCILKIVHLTIPFVPVGDQVGMGRSLQREVVLTAATDGRVTFWDITDVCHLVCRSRTVGRNCGDEDEESDTYDDEVQTESSCESHRHDVNSAHSKHVFEENKLKGNNVAKDILEADVNAGKGLAGVNVGGDVLRKCCSIQLHQSGINSLYVQHMAENRYIVLTGGDDNAIRVTAVSMDTSDTVTRVHTDKLGGHINPHSAQVTGVCLLDKDHVLSASIDQRLCIWKMVQSADTIGLQLVCAQLTSVSDVANISTSIDSETTHVLVSGMGLELFRLQRGDMSKVSTTANASNIISE
ncbi:WD repeat-containing protein 6-like isoform X3 [Dreissena polymorpha]|uniref:WD repeat-containing protein 6-like isoform X3 n=1 Tax=Dreissena polymorpha TaxID=45954 RepID=UPI0022654556|nr:WD repeat-containing protein 6-like isoform X3 [Dreissena polymorpha]